MHHTKVFATIAGLALGAAALSGCTGGTPAPTPTETAAAEPIQVVVFGGLGAEGVLANNANTSVTAALASVAAVNAAGGILGRQIEIQTIDDTADATTAVTKLRELLASGTKPVAVMNSGPSTVADAIIPILTQEKILSFNIGPTKDSSDPTVNPYNFDLSPGAADYINAFVPVIKERGYKKVAIIHGSSAYGELFGKTAEETFKAAGLEVTGNQGFDNKALDMTPQVEALQATNPDVLVMDGYGAPTTYVLEGIQKLGWNVPIMGNNSVAASPATSTEPPTGLLGTDKVKNLTMQVFTSTAYDPKNKPLTEAVELMAKSGPIKSSLILAYNYDSMWLVKAAAEDAGSLDAAALAASLVKPAVQKAAGTQMLTQYNFTDKVHSPKPDASEFRFIKPGPLVNGQFQ